MASRQQLERWADEAAEAEGVDPRLFRSLVTAESGWNAKAGSPAGAQGLTQLMPATARGLGVKNVYDPKENLRGGARYLAQQIKTFGGDVRKAVAAYNAGPGAVQKYGGVPPYAETQAYVRKVLGGAGSGATGRGGGATTPSPSSSSSAAPTTVETSQADPAAQLGATMDFLKTGKVLDFAMAMKGLEAEAPSAAQTVLATPSKAVDSEGVDVGGGARVIGTGGYPLSKRGKIIGTPHGGTHTLGNWQSDNAWDVGTPNGTAIVAVADGEVVKVKGSYSGGAGRFDGYQVTIQTKNGGVFYTHLSRADVKPGQRIRKGQMIGRSGSANGVPHLHIGFENERYGRRVVGAS